MKRDTSSGKSRQTENFPVGSLLIRRDLRVHVHAFYAFARAADDISDHPLIDAQDKITLLDKFSHALLDAHNDDIPSVNGLRRSLQVTGISPSHSLDLLTAFKRDATQLRYASWDELIDYCNYSAAPVGRHVLALHGIGVSAWPANDALCNALQIINHIQDCADDYRELDRCYVPQNLLSLHGGKISDLSAEYASDGLKRTLQSMLDLVEPMLKEARKLPPQISDMRLKAETSVICALAERIVTVLRQRDPLCENVKLGKAPALLATIVGIGRAWM